MKIKDIPLETVVELLPKSISLTYADYRDNLDNRAKEIQDSVQSNNYEAFDDLYNECYGTQSFESIHYYFKNELQKDIMNAFNISHKKTKKLITKFNDELSDELRDRDDSTLIKDLIRNTGKMIFFYATGFLSSGYGYSRAQYRLERMQIKKILSIKDSQFDKSIDSMIIEASYGGELVIYFRDYINKLITEKDSSHIEFKNATIALIDTCGGSGFDTILPKHTFRLPFNRENLFVEKAVSYNYTYQVCGMSEDWCDSTDFKFVDDDSHPEITISDSPINAHLQTEKFLDAVWSKGICTPGDMKISRHKETEYINSFPCGLRCKKCGTFWID